MVKMHSELRLLLGWGVMMCLAGQAVAESASAQQWLDRMSHSFRELNYRGAFSYQRGDRSRSFRIVHAVIDGEEYERLDYLDGEKRNVVRQGHKLECIHMGHKLIRFGLPKSGNESQLPQLSAIDQYYQLQLGDSDRLAGRDVVNLTVQPRDAHRYGYRLALDESTALPLRSELIGEDGKVLERFQFVELELDATISKVDFEGAPALVKAAHGDAVAATSAAVPRYWHLQWVPQGFATVSGFATSDKHGDMLTYTDGLAVFSVFLERIDADHVSDTEAAARQGATTAFSSDLKLAEHAYRITVVGEIPQHTARMIARSVALSAPE